MENGSFQGSNIEALRKALKAQASTAQDEGRIPPGKHVAKLKRFEWLDGCARWRMLFEDGAGREAWQSGYSIYNERPNWLLVQMARAADISFDTLDFEKAVGRTVAITVKRSSDGQYLNVVKIERADDGGQEAHCQPSAPSPDAVAEVPISAAA